MFWWFVDCWFIHALEWKNTSIEATSIFHSVAKTFWCSWTHCERRNGKGRNQRPAHLQSSHGWDSRWTSGRWNASSLKRTPAKLHHLIPLGSHSGGYKRLKEVFQRSFFYGGLHVHFQSFGEASRDGGKVWWANCSCYYSRPRMYRCWDMW